MSDCEQQDLATVLLAAVIKAVNVATIAITKAQNIEQPDPLQHQTMATMIMEEHPQVRDDINWVISEIERDVADEIRHTMKTEIKAELRMELFMQLEKIHTELEKMKSNANDAAKQPVVDSCGIRNFEVSNDVASIIDLGTAHDTIKHLQSYNNVRSDHNDIIIHNDIPESLATNSLFNSISKRVENAQRGAPIYTASDYVNARGSSIDSEYAENVLRSDADLPLQPDVTTNDSDDDLWDKLLRQKYSEK